MSGERAAEKDVERMCEKMLVDGEYEGPDATNDLAACLRVGSQYLNEGRIAGADEKNLDLLYRWLDDVSALQVSLQAPSPAAPARGGALGVPGALATTAPAAPPAATPPAAAPPPA
jgi:hypothetical protein